MRRHAIRGFLFALACMPLLPQVEGIPQQAKIKGPAIDRQRIRAARQEAGDKHIVPPGKDGARDAALELREAILTPPIPFVPVTPCRILDTRNATGVFGGPVLGAGRSRSVPIPQSTCGIPATALAYSLNLTVVPRGPLSYLSTYPTGSTQPAVSTLNAFDGAVVSNAAVVPAGTSGAVTVFATNTTDVIMDINGYFAPATGGADFYPVQACRVADTRSGSGKSGAFGAPSIAGGSLRTIPIPQSGCAIPADARAYSLNITVVPQGPLSFLTLFPAGQPQPTVSTLNSFTGRIAANAALVQAGVGGAISLFATNTTDVIVDITGYFK